MQTMRAEILVEVKRDLAVGPGAQAMTSLLELALDRFVTIELAIADDRRAIVFAGDRLIAGGEIDDAEARVAQTDPAVGAHPVTLAVRAAMPQAGGCPADTLKIDFSVTRKNRDDATHAAPHCPELKRIGMPCRK